MNLPEFEKVDLTGMIPETTICVSCAKQGLIHKPTETAIVYCPHTLRGAYKALDRPFKIISGIERSLFLDVVSRGLLFGELRTDIGRDLAMIIQSDASEATKH